MHMWLALHVHRQVHCQQYTLIVQHAQEACRVLKRWIQGTSVETAEPKASPKQVRTARKAKGKTASVRAVAAATRKPNAPKVVPTTPKRAHSMYAAPTSRRFQLALAPGSDPSQGAESQAVLRVEKDVTLLRKTSRRIVALLSMYAFHRLRSCLTSPPCLDMTIHLVGFIGHVVLKLELLQVARQVCERPSIGQHDGKCC